MVKLRQMKMTRYLPADQIPGAVQSMGAVDADQFVCERTSRGDQSQSARAVKCWRCLIQSRLPFTVHVHVQQHVLTYLTIAFVHSEKPAYGTFEVQDGGVIGNLAACSENLLMEQRRGQVLHTQRHTKQ